MNSQHRNHILVALLLLFLLIGVFNLHIAHQYLLSPHHLSGNAIISGNANGRICIGFKPPVLQDIPDQTAIIGQLFQYTANATQSSGADLNYTDDTSLFDINEDMGLISFTPGAADVGTYAITLTAILSQACSSANDSDSFVLTVTSSSQQPQENEHPPRRPPPAIIAPVEQQTVSAPYHVLDIRKIIIDGNVVYDQYRNIRAAEYVMDPNSRITVEITVRNVGFDDLTNVHLNLQLGDDAIVVAINPATVERLLPNEDYTFVVQIEVGEDPFDFVVQASADQDQDTEVIPLVVEPTFETPQFGFEVPPWLPLLIAIPLLFFLGYSLMQNKKLLWNFLKDLITGLLAWLLRRTYFIDEDMLRRLMKARKMNKFLHVWVVPDVHGRYHNTYKNLRTMELKKEQYDKISQVIRNYAIGGEMGTLIVLTADKPHPRIMTAFEPSKRLHEDYKRIKFYDPIKKEQEKNKQKEQIIAVPGTLSEIEK